MFKWIARAFKVMGVLGTTIPAVLADGVITVNECLNICKQLFEAFDVKMVIIPEEVKDVANKFLKVQEVIKK